MEAPLHVATQEVQEEVVLGAGVGPAAFSPATTSSFQSGFLHIISFEFDND